MSPLVRPLFALLAAGVVDGRFVNEVRSVLALVGEEAVDVVVIVAEVEGPGVVVELGGVVVCH
jgi:hypothetical protein